MTPEYTEFKISDDQPDFRMEPHECISNTLEAAALHGHEYAEGIALSATSGLWYRHAWNMDGDEVVDYTWETTGLRYIGRIIPAKQKMEWCLERDAYYFDDYLPFVPDGALGLDCWTKEQVTFFRKGGAKISGYPE